MKFLKTKKTIILIVIILIIFSLNFFRKETRGVFYFFSSPIQRTLWEWGKSISGFEKTVLDFRSLQTENEKLKVEINRLKTKVSLLKETKKENEILREALDIGLQEDFKLKFAQLIGKDVDQDFILINKGEEDGIEKEFPVVTESKVLIGRIEEVNKKFSKVMLISNKESVFDAEIQDKDISGVVKGQGTLSLFLDFIPTGVEIKKGDKVITSSLSGVFPQGILVGRIKEVKREDIKPFQRAEIEPFFNISKIKNIFVITNF